MFVNDVHPSNAEVPIEVTLSGSVMLSNVEQPAKTLSFIAIMPSGSVMLVKEVHA
jgi:hypothetical protein